MLEEIFWEMLPEGLKEYFDVKSYEKDEKRFRIILEEKNKIFELPEKYHGRKVEKMTIKRMIIDLFPIQGLKGELELRKRYWKFEGVNEWYTKKIPLCLEGTKLEKKFGDFLKEFYREFPDSDLPGWYVDESELKNIRKTIQGEDE